MKNFNITRFSHTLLWQMAERKKKNFSVVAFGFLFAVIGALAQFPFGTLIITPLYMEGVASVLAVIAVAYALTCGAFIVSNLPDKISRLNTFILPASKLEKFASRYAYLLIAVPLLALVGIVAGDLLQMLVYMAIVGDASSMTLSFFSLLSTNYLYKGGAEATLVAYALLWLIHSIYLLLGTFFRRHAWLKSNLLLLVLLIVLSMAVAFGTKGVLDFIYGEGNYNIVLVEGLWPTIAECTVMLALTIFNYWAAFRIYARMQVVNNRWYNF